MVDEQQVYESVERLAAERAGKTIVEADVDETAIWSLRGVSKDIRRRMKVRAALSDKTIPEAVTRACEYWLADGAPFEKGQ